MSLDTYIYTFITIHNRDREHICHPSKVTSRPSIYSQFPPIHPQPLAATDLLRVSADWMKTFGMCFICVVSLSLSVIGTNAVLESVLFYC